MKIIDTLQVTVTYKVSIGNIKVSNKIYEQLNKGYHNGNTFSSDQNVDALDWLNSNIHEGDCHTWQTEIDNMILKE